MLTFLLEGDFVASRMKQRFFDAAGLRTDAAEQYGGEFARIQRDVMFWVGDLALYAESQWAEDHYQIWPEWVSPGMVDRAKGVCRAYPEESDRQFDCTYSQYMQNAGKPDRKQRLAAIVEQGLTTDESRKPSTTERVRWLLAVDADYWLNVWYHSGETVEAGHGVSDWLCRTVERLKEKGVSDVAMCFDSRRNFRKELTADWEKPYKDRPPKEEELLEQLHNLRTHLERAGFLCIDVDGFESDDLMATYANSFDGKVTLLVRDKDLRQCLSNKCNMLTKVDWEKDPTSGQLMPVYYWLSADQHTAGFTYQGATVEGITPSQFTEFQAIAGDSTDTISGAEGIGGKIAADLIKEFGSLDSVIQAAREDDERIKPKKREALLELAETVDIVRQLVTLRTDVRVSMNTRLT